MCGILSVCLFPRTICANDFASSISIELEKHIRKHFVEHDNRFNLQAWHPRLNMKSIETNIAKNIRNILIKKKDLVPIYYINGNIVNYISTQIAYYLFNLIINDNNIAFNIIDIPIDDVFINHKIPDFDETTLNNYLTNFKKFPTRNIMLNTTDNIEKELLDKKLISTIEYTLNRHVEYTNIFMNCYNMYESLKHKCNNALEKEINDNIFNPEVN
jgi:hypothetical protein